MFLIRWAIRLVLVVVLFFAFVGATFYLFVFPHMDRVTRADAVVVLSGGKRDRLPKGLELVQRGVAPTLVISDGRAQGYPEANKLCKGGRPFKVVCFRPDPYSTRGEAEAVARLARKHGWRSLVVVTSRYHVYRARILFKRCFKGHLAVTGSMPSLKNMVNGTLQEWPKLVYEETLVRAC
ncbi:MAG TPA: YdcF family protein [Gaiellaceae bacterium]|nr:YdcF family protein [Gaiellaceae bacterium]